MRRLLLVLSLLLVPVAASALTVNYLLVGGGGSGGDNASGGGGGGDVETGSMTISSAQSVTIGAGGAGQVGGAHGLCGGTSIFNGVSAYGGEGGGAGGGPGPTNCSPYNGSGGGGASYGAGYTGGSAGPGSNSSNGGNGALSTSYDGGGGGGATQVGYAGTGTGQAGNGGQGLSNTLATGSAQVYGAGGGGGSYGGAAGTGGTNAGSGCATNNCTGGGATANFGGGGGGDGAGGSTTSGAGGSGVLVISYATSYGLGTATGSYTQTTVSGNYVYIFTGGGSFTPPAAPTATNTPAYTPTPTQTPSATQTSTPTNVPSATPCTNPTPAGKIPGLALVPPKGFVTLAYGYPLGGGLTQAQCEGQMDAMVANGMVAAGYTLFMVDAGWVAERNSAGVLVPNSYFPNMAALAAYAHADGELFGIYTDAGDVQCGGTQPGSLGFEYTDAATFASWGVDYVKDDSCGNFQGSTPQELYTTMGNAIAAQNRPMIYSVNDSGLTGYSGWTPPICQMARGFSDMANYYNTMITNFRQDYLLASYATPGYWNNPDLVYIDPGVSMTWTMIDGEIKNWAAESAPLFTYDVYPSDMTTTAAAAFSLLTNPYLLDCDNGPYQAPLLVGSIGNGEEFGASLGGILGGAAYKVLVVNDTGGDFSWTVHWSDFGQAGTANVFEVTGASGVNLGNYLNQYTFSDVSSTGSRLLIVNFSVPTPTRTPLPTLTITPTVTPTFTPVGIPYTLLVVGGGGGGGDGWGPAPNGGGGGGGGQVLSTGGTLASGGTIVVIVGQGGIHGPNPGQYSSFGAITATGGGYGGSGDNNGPSAGSSGGGGASGTGYQTGGIGTAGGDGSNGQYDIFVNGGGGGGAGGQYYPGATACNGGGGVWSSITGTNVDYGNGGGGGLGLLSSGSWCSGGSSTGDGSGAVAATSGDSCVGYGGKQAFAGAPNTGDGGGGGASNCFYIPGANGGSGRVVLSYPSSYGWMQYTGACVTTTVGLNDVYIWNGSGTFSPYIVPSPTPTFSASPSVSPTYTPPGACYPYVVQSLTFTVANAPEFNIPFTPISSPRNGLLCVVVYTSNQDNKSVLQNVQYVSGGVSNNMNPNLQVPSNGPHEGIELWSYAGPFLMTAPSITFTQPGYNSINIDGGAILLYEGAGYTSGQPSVIQTTYTQSMLNAYAIGTSYQPQYYNGTVMAAYSGVKSLIGFPSGYTNQAYFHGYGLYCSVDTLQGVQGTPQSVTYVALLKNSAASMLLAEIAPITNAACAAVPTRTITRTFTVSPTPSVTATPWRTY